MIKSTFSRNTSKLPPSKKNLSLAGLAQKLQDVDINNTPSTLPDGALSNPVVPDSFTDDGNSVLPNRGNYTRTSLLVNEKEDFSSNVDKLVLANAVEVSPVISYASQNISSCSSVDNTVATSINKQEDSENIPDISSPRSLNDCSAEFGRLHLNPAAEITCRSAKPTPFGRTMSAIPNAVKRAGQTLQKKAGLHERFSYFRQIDAVARLRQRHYCSNVQTLIPFDFSTPSPDDVVREKQKLAFGERATGYQKAAVI